MANDATAESIAWELMHACNRVETPYHKNPFKNRAYCTTALSHWNNGICIPKSIQYYGHPLYIAARVGNLLMVKNLLSAGADVNAEGGPREWIREGHETFNRTALHAAAYKGHLAVVKVLVEHDGCEVNGVNMPTQRDRLERGAIPLTALAYAVAYNHVNIVKVLLMKGADASVELVTLSAIKHDVHQRGAPDCEAARVVALAHSRWTAQAKRRILQCTTLPESLVQLIKSFLEQPGNV
jgi:ankyrin repeat protein